MHKFPELHVEQAHLQRSKAIENAMEIVRRKQAKSRAALGLKIVKVRIEMEQRRISVIFQIVLQFLSIVKKRNNGKDRIRSYRLKVKQLVDANRKKHISINFCETICGNILKWNCSSRIKISASGECFTRRLCDEASFRLIRE